MQVIIKPRKISNFSGLTNSKIKRVHICILSMNSIGIK